MLIQNIAVGVPDIVFFQLYELKNVMYETVCLSPTLSHLQAW